MEIQGNNKHPGVLTEEPGCRLITRQSYNTQDTAVRTNINYRSGQISEATLPDLRKHSPIKQKYDIAQ